MVQIAVREGSLAADAEDFTGWAATLADLWRHLVADVGLTADQSGAVTERLGQFWSRYVEARDGLARYLGPDSEAGGPGACGALRSFAVALRTAQDDYATARHDIGRLIAQAGKQA